MSDLIVVQRIRDEINRASWTPDASKDFREYLKEDWRVSSYDQVRGTSMPCSPSCKRYEIDVEMDRDLEADYSMKFELSDELKAVLPQLPDQQITHRSRPAALAFGHLRVPEMDFRISKADKAKELIKDLTLSDSKSEALRQAVWSKIRPNLGVNMKKIRTYIKDHRASSIMRGVKWEHLFDLDAGDWKLILDDVLQLYDRWAEGEFDGMTLSTPTGTGLRARTDSLNREELKLGSHSGHISRTRIVAFTPALSILNVFVTQKDGYYRAIVEAMKQVLAPDHASMIHSPLLEGGEVYNSAIDWFTKYKYSPYDGVGWETQAADILGPSWSLFSQNIGGQRTLLSGVWATSLVGTAASIHTANHAGMLSKSSKCVILGDDINLFGRKALGTRDELPNVTEYQSRDYDAGFLLGLTYKYQKEPAITGVKITSDKAPASRPFRIDRSNTAFIIDKSKHTDQERGVHAEMYTGYHMGRPLSTILAGIKSEDFRGPGQMLLELAENPEEQHGK
jgi:hypothetical protein